MGNLATHEPHELQQEIKAGGVVYRKATPDDDASLRQVLREISMDSWVNVSTEHEPSYFESSNIFGVTETILASSDDHNQSTVGICSSVSMPVYINGMAKDAGYLSELRVLPEYRHKLSVIRNGFKSIEALNQQHTYWFTSIAKENSTARRLLEANLKGMPAYQPRGELLTIALPVCDKLKRNLLVPATEEDIPALVEFYRSHNAGFQYAPVISEQWLRGLDGQTGLRVQDFWLLKDKGAIKAACAIWDQRKLKQSVVRGYRFPLNIIRQAYNLYAKLSGRVALPAVGDKINYIFIAFLAVSGEASKHTKAIVTTARKLVKEKGANVAMLGVSTQNPIASYLETIPHHAYSTIIESVTWPTYREQKIDDRPVQPEIAVI